MKYLTKDENNTFMIWENKPQLQIPLDRNESEYWEAKGEFEAISEAEALRLLSKIPFCVEIIE